MVKQTKSLIGLCALLFLLLAACSAQTDANSTSQTQTQVTASTDALPANNSVVETTTNVISESITPSAEAAESVTEASEANSAPHESDEDYMIDETAVTQISLADEGISVDGGGVTVNGRTATITAAGTYNLSGSLTEGQIVVDTQDEETVHLIFNGINISNSSTAPITIANAEDTVILLAENSENVVTDGADYVFANAKEDEPNAALFSKEDLAIYGSGSLAVQANYNDGIASKDGLIIAGGNITVDAVDDGIRGKDYLIVKDGTLTITSGGDGLKSDEDEDSTKGYIAIEGGSITITSGGDAIQAQTDVLISGGTFNLTAGGGSNGILAADASAKGIKADVNVNIDGGTFNINTADDAVHSNDNMVINDGNFVISTGDDGFHADNTLEINGGTIDITDSYEGIESAVITINNGEFHIVSSDDGINVAGGNDGSGFAPGGGPRPGGGGPRDGFNGAPGQDTVAEYTGTYYLYINGGYVVVNANGDGLDVNGAIVMTDGIVIVNGPTEQMNGALDHDGPFTITGGSFVAAGSAGMAQTADASSTQNALLLNLNGTLPAGTLINIEDNNGNDVLTFAPIKPYQSIAFSSPELVTGQTYTVYYGGTSTGTATDGLYIDGDYEPGTEYTTFTVSNVVTSLGSGGFR